MKYWQHPKLCEYCGEEFTVKCVAAAKTRFCGRSCSAKWRMRQPEIIARVHTKEIHAKIGKKVSKWLRTTPEGRKNVDRIAALNPMTMPGVREKVSKTLRQMGHRPPWIGGKGRGMTRPQRLLLHHLGVGWLAEYPVPVNPKRANLPTCLYLDIGNPALMIAIEVDGATHCTHTVKEADQRKTEYLNGLGWKVLRFWNRQILDWIDTEMPMDHFISTTFKQNDIHLSPLPAC